MTKAREVIRNCLTFSLNRLSPGEQEDADLFGRCLDALNHIIDKWNGGKSLLWREIITDSSPITGSVGTLGVTWPGLQYGDQILSATVRYTTGVDEPISPITVEQYLAIPIKGLSNIPQQYAHDGGSTVYLYPAANGQTIKLRTKQAASMFADLDTDYVMPQGYKSALVDQLAEVMAPSLLGGIPPVISSAAAASRRRVGAQEISPSILNGYNVGGRLASFLAGR